MPCARCRHTSTHVCRHVGTSCTCSCTRMHRMEARVGCQRATHIDTCVLCVGMQSHADIHVHMPAQVHGSSDMRARWAHVHAHRRGHVRQHTHTHACDAREKRETKRGRAKGAPSGRALRPSPSKPKWLLHTHGAAGSPAAERRKTSLRTPAPRTPAPRQPHSPRRGALLPGAPSTAPPCGNTQPSGAGSSRPATWTPSGVPPRGFLQPRHTEGTEQDRREPGPGSPGPWARAVLPSPASLGTCDSRTCLAGRRQRRSVPTALGAETVRRTAGSDRCCPLAMRGKEKGR